MYIHNLSMYTSVYSNLVLDYSCYILSTRSLSIPQVPSEGMRNKIKNVKFRMKFLDPRVEMVYDLSKSPIMLPLKCSNLPRCNMFEFEVLEKRRGLKIRSNGVPTR